MIRTDPQEIWKEYEKGIDYNNGYAPSNSYTQAANAVNHTTTQPQAANTGVATAQETNTQVNAQQNPKTEQTAVRGEQAGIQPDANAAPLIPDTNSITSFWRYYVERH